MPAAVQSSSRASAPTTAVAPASTFAPTAVAVERSTWWCDVERPGTAAWRRWRSSGLGCHHRRPYATNRKSGDESIDGRGRRRGTLLHQDRDKEHRSPRTSG
ncbi:Os08g0240700 [Oryza sativa Japonica Group]|uniref:Uncharacterized protein n=2 Tax=Oryza sativa subsp. japonica TaxID=39947 RepID=A0A0P0XDC4_ORYSJ|nr:hypothetical protein [Oryza sativa Japonica Group]BAD05561.1 hypothetical protein [Oryza sativa Japonica Group]BAT04493.1 Os08g0240700 [Oryza sativa Japonica Group]